MQIKTLQIKQPMATFLFFEQLIAIVLFGQPIASFLVEALATVVKLALTRHFDIDE